MPEHKTAMDNNNFNSLINNLIKLNRELQSAIAAANVNIETARTFCKKLDEMEKSRKRPVSETRTLAMQKLRYLN